MNFKKVMMIKAFAALVVGLSLLLIPDIIFSALGAELLNGGILAARIYGASALGIMFLTWFGKDLEDTVARKVIALDLCIYDLIACVVTSIAILSGILNSIGVLVAILFLFFAVEFGYLLMMKEK